LESLVRDFRHALRGMRRRPAFAVAAVLTLALGIGANTAIFGVVQGVLIRPLPYPNADDLIGIWHTGPGLQAGDLTVAPTMYFTYRDESRTFQNIGLWSTGGQSVTGIGEPEQVRTAFVTYGTLQALGVQPKLGRWFSEADDTPGTPGPDPVILTYGYWQRPVGGRCLGDRAKNDHRRASVRSCGCHACGLPIHQLRSGNNPDSAIRPKASGTRCRRYSRCRAAQARREDC